MDDLIHQGKILYWGTSEWSGEQIQEALNICEKYNLYKPQTEQPHYSMLHRERVEGDILPVTEPRGIGLVVWSPLESGLLSGKYDDSLPDDSRIARFDWLHQNLWKEELLDTVRKLKPVADDLGISRAQLAIAWTLRQSGVSSAITGATRPSQIEETVGAVGIDLEDAVLDKIDEILAPLSEK